MFESQKTKTDSPQISLTLEEILCRDWKQFLAGSSCRSWNFTPLNLKDFGAWNHCLAGSANWKFRVAESSKTRNWRMDAKNLFWP
jgi:hypothetical protein